MSSLCVSLYSNIVLLSACQRLSALCIGCSVYRVLCVSGPLFCLSFGLYSWCALQQYQQRVSRVVSTTF